nr:GPR1/FUN34/YaaH family transporter [Nostoc sp. EkiNYC01]
MQVFRLKHFRREADEGSRGVYYFFGGPLMMLGGSFEFLLGNTFSFVVFCSFGAFWLSFGATLTPSFNATAAYGPDNPAAGTFDPMFAATFAYFHIYMGVLCFIYTVAAVRTNILFVLIFAACVGAFGCLAAFFFEIAQGADAHGLQYTAGVLTFIASLLGWYLLFAQILAAVDFPLNLPVGDLGGFVKGASERGKSLSGRTDG